MFTLLTIVKNSAKDNGYITQETVEKNYELLKGLNPGFPREEIIPKDLGVKLPDKPAQDVITMDKYAAKGAKYFKSEGFKFDEKLKNLEKQMMILFM